MQTRERNSAIYWAHIADTADSVVCFFVTIAFVVSLFNPEADTTLAIVFAVWAGGLRIRMLVRSSRVDALLREGEEEARRNPDSCVMVCPKCQRPFRLPPNSILLKVVCTNCGSKVRPPK